MQPQQEGCSSVKIEFWLSNALFFVGMHVLAVVVLWIHPPSSLRRETIIMLPFLWHAAMFGITVGYHRFWSHRAFRAGVAVRAVLAVCGAMGVQGSIKVRCLRHRLHHRFTDDLIHDPYAATRGMLFAHMGWIFYKPSYPRMATVARDDLDRDIVVRVQHRYYVPIAIFSAFAFPSMLAWCWGDALGGLYYGGIWMRLLIWHCTFCVNSLAHWKGLQPYSDEVTARGNTILAMLTNGEGNHNFHAFPHDFRSGLSPAEWDPSKWLIFLLHRLRLVWGIRRAREEDIIWAREDMKRREAGLDFVNVEVDTGAEVWTLERAIEYATHGARCVLVIDRRIVDATALLGDHPGGAALLRRYSLRAGEETWKEGSWAFHGGLNNHSRAAPKRMRELCVARLE
ncbi:hypothetical protein EXIGLDRAFT_669322 [Exidia glandulosa HHB12029]|uniref:Acyl-CoA desaturase n=1 Tax=Exidia glandulosa HHB12029 TaxID=1314781 RepID=A0A165M151_EXIGL|nr:hypothetical protein EXIGLDRAFT_669322 [Exidia glandulosa HHB12029]